MLELELRKLLNLEELDLVDSMSEPRETPFPAKALKEEGWAAAAGRDALPSDPSVAVPLWLPPPKKLVGPPELPVEAWVVPVLFAAAVFDCLKLGSSLYLTKGHLFSQALTVYGEVSNHFMYPKA